MTTTEPPRAIGLAGAVLINLNAVIGAGIFALPALLCVVVVAFQPRWLFGALKYGL